MKRIFPALLENDAIKSLLGEDILRLRQSHAYIIEGPDGSGKHTAALQIAMAILCENKHKEQASLPCGTCTSCKKISSGFSTSVEYISRGSAATLQVETVRNMLSGVSYLPEDGDKRIYIIEDAHKMTPSAQNALLLTLEEPPAHAVFILLTSDSGALLETVRSRTHILKTQLLSASFILSALKDMQDMGKLPPVSEETVKLAASAASGCLGTAIELCSADSSSPVLKLRRLGLELADALVFSEPYEAMLYCRSIELKRADCETVFYYAIAYIRDLIALKNNSTVTLICTDTQEAEARARAVALPTLYRIYSLLCSAQEDITRRNASVATVLCTLAANASK